jgi:hypothetical protein
MQERKKVAPRARFELATLPLTAEATKNLTALSGVACNNPGAIFPFLVAPNPASNTFGRDVFTPARSNAQFNDVYQLQNSASSTYNGVSFTLNRRMSDELAFSASYTLSKTFDDASDFDEQPQNPFDPAAENALSRRFVFNALWELPIGDEEDKGANSGESAGWLTRTFQHIELAPIFTAETGRPVNPLTGLESEPRLSAIGQTARFRQKHASDTQSHNHALPRSEVLSVRWVKALGPRRRILQPV